jgi:hypothetical protein
MRHDSDRWPMPKEALSAPRTVIIAARRLRPGGRWRLFKPISTMLLSSRISYCVPRPLRDQLHPVALEPRPLLMH